MSTQFEPMPLQKRRVQLELSKPAPQTVQNNRWSCQRPKQPLS